MLTYRGDKFVKGKKFKINEKEYRFSKRNDDKLIFEAISDGSKYSITEEEFNKAEKMLTEKINQENKEINEIIGKVLRSKGLARKYEDMLKKKGITIDYDQGQGVTLIGSNGKVLSATSRYVGGPSKPGQNGTHEKSYSKYDKNRYKEARESLEKLKNMDRDDIIRKYNELSTKEAMEKHKEDISKAEREVEVAKEDMKSGDSYYRTRRREGHLNRPGSVTWSNRPFDKGVADTYVDYLNYLTKPDTGKDFRTNKTYNPEGHPNAENYNYEFDDHVKNPVFNKDTDTTEDIKKYKSLKGDVDSAKRDINWRDYRDGDYYGSYTSKVLSDKQLEAKIKEMRDEVEKKIVELKAQNDENKNDKGEAIKELKNKEKELDKFLKSKGIREAVLDIINGRKLNESNLVDSGNSDADYIETRLSEIYDDVLTLAQECEHMGFHETSKTLNDVLGLLDFIKVK